jgi:ABC-type uncharacterized transport system fused permease/ATPase subunit
MVLGNLRDQMTYPHFRKGSPSLDKELTELLDQMDLKHVINRVGGFDARLNWEDVLSLGDRNAPTLVADTLAGEQQRVAMVRLFYHRPSVAVLDECTSALNVELQQKCMFYPLVQ